MIGYEIASATRQTFVDYITYLISMKPDFEFLWLGMKDLSITENETLIIDVLDLLDNEYSLKDNLWF